MPTGLIKMQKRGYLISAHVIYRCVIQIFTQLALNTEAIMVDCLVLV